jgi:multiple sugar transport system permease protein
MTQSEKMKRKKRAKTLRIGKRTLLSLLIWAGGLIMVFPFFWMLSASFKGMNSVFVFPIEWIPKEPTLRGYVLLFDGTVSFVTFFLNSVKVTVLALVGTFFSCTLAGYAYAKINFVGRNKFFLMKLMTTMLPALVTLLPTFIVYSRIGLVDSHMALWMPAAFGGAFGVFIMRQAFVGLPSDLMDASKIDGASHPRIYWSVAIPNVKPYIATLLFMYFIWTWNDYEKPLLYLRSERLFTMPFAVKYFADDQSQNYPAIMAANVCMLTPIIVLFFAAQKFFVASLVTSGIKS